MICSMCSEELPEGYVYHTGNNLICEECYDRLYKEEPEQDVEAILERDGDD